MTNAMEETRIDLTKQTPEVLAQAKHQAQQLFRLNHTLPMTEAYDELLHDLFPHLGENSRINAPLTAVRPHMVRIGRNTIVMNGCLMMAAGGITIGNNVQMQPTYNSSRTITTLPTAKSLPASPFLSATTHGSVQERRFCRV